MLPADVAKNEERLARFRREARVLAALNHPGIASIYGLEKADGQPFLVMELAPGEDLKQRLERGPIPVGEAIDIAKQIAAALRDAHEHGIVHRDLKPANVKLAPEGEVKILDFGLARAWGGEGEDAASDLYSSPTEAFTGTSAGVILGTAAYMSPEQAAGKAVDKRSDIWSFGVVLFEMLTGERLFTGETASEILASVIKEEPDWERLPKDSPPSTLRLLRHCLRKKRRERLQDAGDIPLELEEGDAGDVRVPPRAPSSRVTSLALGVALVGIGLAAGVALERGAAVESAAPLARLTLELPLGTRANDACAVVSPDGRYVAFFENRVLGSPWLLPLDGGEARPLRHPGCYFWSPDSTQIGFAVWHDGFYQLRRVDAAGGGAQTLASVEAPEYTFAGGTWVGGRIVLAVDGSLYSVPVSGGDPTVLLSPDGSRGESFLSRPQLLPDGRTLLFTANVDGAPERWVARLDDLTDRKRVQAGVSWSQCVSSGHLIFARAGELLAQSFDFRSGEVSGDPILLGPVAMHSRFGSGLFDVSPSGVLAYIEGGEPRSELTWFDRQGTQLATLGKGELYQELRLSPDDRHVAVTVGGTRGGSEIWTFEVARGVATKTSPGAWQAEAPLWSPDGRELYFQRLMDDNITRPYHHRVGSAAPPTLLVESEQHAAAPARGWRRCAGG